MLLSTERRAHGIALAVFILLAAWLLRDGTPPGRVMVSHESLTRSGPWSVVLEHPDKFNGYLVDQARLFYPYLYEAARVYAGEADPYWTSRGGGGQPFLGNISSSLLHPLTLLVAVFDLNVVPWLQAMLVLVLGAFFTWLFLRRMGLSAPAAAFGAVAFGFGGHQVLWLQYALSHTLLALPFTFWAVERVLDDPSRRRVGVLAIAFSMFILGGHPETGLVAGLVAGFWALYRLWDSHGRVLAVGAALLGLALAAVQWMPFLEYARLSHGLQLREMESSRLEGGVSFGASVVYVILFLGAVAILRSAAGKGFSKRILAVAACTLSMVMARKMGMAIAASVVLLPELYGNPTAGGVFTGAQDFPGLNASFVGALPPILLALGFFVGMGQGFIRFFAVVALVLWGAAFHLPGVEGLVRLIPGMSDVATTRMLGPVGFCTACGGAVVLDRLCGRGVKPGVLIGVGRLALTILLSVGLGSLILMIPDKDDAKLVHVEGALLGPPADFVHDGRSLIPICIHLEQPVDDLKVMVDGLQLREGAAPATLPDEPLTVRLLTYRMEEGRHRLRVVATTDGKEQVLADQPLQVGRTRTLSGRDLIMLGMALACLGWLMLRHRPKGRWVLAGVATLDVLWFGAGYNVAAAEEDLFPPTQTIDFLRAQEPPFRIFTESTIIPPDTQFVAGVDHLLSYDNLGFDRTYRWLINVPIQMDAFASFTFSRESVDYGSQRFDSLDVRYIITPRLSDLSDIPGMELVHESENQVWENTDNLGRAWVVGQALDLHTAPLIRLFAADVGEVAILEQVWADPLGGRGIVHDVDHRGSEIEIDVETDGPSLLVLAENLAPGWTASVDGGPEIDPLPVDLAWQAIPLEEGRHTVLFTYDPAGLAWGKRISIGAALVLLLMLFVPRRMPWHSSGENDGGSA